MTTRAALYARISQDDTGEAVGVRRQLEDARELAERQGWQIVAAYEDNDVSAFKGADRPGYRALMADADAGRIDRVIVFHFSRLWRNRRDRVDGLERLQKAGVSVVAIKGPTLDLGSAYGRAMAGILGEFDTMESEVKSERVAAKARQRAQDGGPNGAVPYGWRRVVETNDFGQRIGARDELDPEAAPVVAEVCRRLLAGESLLGVTAWLNASGVPAPGASFRLRNRGRGLENPDGTQWGKTSVKKLALRAQNCGMRQWHQGRPDEQLLPMKAEPIISVDEWETLRAMLTDPARSVKRGGARKHLLSYSEVGQCGVCGGPLRAATKRGKYGKPSDLYVCLGKGCVGRSQEAVDALVRGVLVARLSRDDAADLLTSDDAAAKAASDRLAGLEARLATAADEYADGHLDAAQLRRITDRLRPQVVAAREDLERSRPNAPLALLASVVGPLAAERWDGLEVVQRQALASALLASVAILPTRQGPGFDPKSVRIQWR